MVSMLAMTTPTRKSLTSQQLCIVSSYWGSMLCVCLSGAPVLSLWRSCRQLI